jgi:hypothetical protein
MPRLPEIGAPRFPVFLLISLAHRSKLKIQPFLERLKRVRAIQFAADAK